MKYYVLECCVDSVESAVNAQKGGASRLELCSGLVIGGLTPSICLFKKVKELVNIPIHVLIRPRFGDFCYSEYEFEIMKEEIKLFKEAGANGVVIGILSKDGNLDIERMKLLVNEAKGLNVTLHRAFDMCVDPLKAMEEAISIQINTILTSGCCDSSKEGITLLKKLIEKANNNIDIMVGGGVNPDNIELLATQIKAKEYHMSGKISIDSDMKFRKESVSMGLKGFSEYEIWRTDDKNVSKVKDILGQI